MPLPVVPTTALGSSWRTASGCGATSDAWTPEAIFGSTGDLRGPARRTLAERAAQELRASGETARKRDPSTLVELTPMELKVAELVSRACRTRTSPAQCWVSPRTVAFHLRNVFAKAGVTSRGELAQLDLG